MNAIDASLNTTGRQQSGATGSRCWLPWIAAAAAAAAAAIGTRLLGGEGRYRRGIGERLLAGTDTVGSA